MASSNNRLRVPIIRHRQTPRDRRGSTSFFRGHELRALKMKPRNLIPPAEAEERSEPEITSKSVAGGARRIRGDLFTKKLWRARQIASRCRIAGIPRLPHWVKYLLTGKP